MEPGVLVQIQPLPLSTSEKVVMRNLFFNQEPAKQEPKPFEYPEDFEQFWAHYPRRVAKGDALKVWLKLNKTDRKAAIERAEWVAGCWAYYDPEGQRASFIPHPATWLNARGWDDSDGAVKLAARGK